MMLNIRALMQEKVTIPDFSLIGIIVNNTDVQFPGDFSIVPTMVKKLWLMLRGHLSKYHPLSYTKQIHPVMALTTSKGFEIGPSYMGHLYCHEP